MFHRAGQLEGPVQALPRVHQLTGIWSSHSHTSRGITDRIPRTPINCQSASSSNLGTPLGLFLQFFLESIRSRHIFAQPKMKRAPTLEDATAIQQSTRVLKSGPFQHPILLRKLGDACPTPCTTVRGREKADRWWSHKKNAAGVDKCSDVPRWHRLSS